MADGLTTEGYDALRTADFLEIIREEFEDRTGLSPEWARDEALGQLTAIMAERLGALSEISQAVYDAKDPNNATGQSLRSIAQLATLSQDDATPGTALQQLDGDVGTAVSSSKTVIGGGDGSLEWELTRDVRIGHSIAVTSVAANETITVMIDGNSVEYRMNGDDTPSDVLRSLETLINDDPDTAALVDAFTWAVDSNEVNRLTIEPEVGGYTFSASASGTASVSATQGRAYVIVEATEPGDFPARAGDIDRIGDGVRGWESTTNPAPASAGTDVESFANFRRRYFESLQSPGNGATSAVLANLLDYEFVQAALVLENELRTSQTIEGVLVEANSLYVVIYPPTLTLEQQRQIAATIWRSKSTGTRTQGNDVQTQVESVDGFEHPVNFDLADEVNIDINVELTLDTGFDIADVKGSIEAQIQEYFTDDISVGDDVRRLPVLARIDTVDGVISVDVLEWAIDGNALSETDIQIDATSFGIIDDLTVTG